MHPSRILFSLLLIFTFSLCIKGLFYRQATLDTLFMGLQLKGGGVLEAICCPEEIMSLGQEQTWDNRFKSYKHPNQVVPRFLVGIMFGNEGSFTFMRHWSQNWRLLLEIRACSYICVSLLGHCKWWVVLDNGLLSHMGTNLIRWSFIYQSQPLGAEALCNDIARTCLQLIRLDSHALKRHYLTQLGLTLKLWSQESLTLSQGIWTYFQPWLRHEREGRRKFLKCAFIK